MSAKVQVTRYSERVEIAELVTSGERDPEIARYMCYSISTVRKWRRRFQRMGHAGLTSIIGRPKTGPLGHFPAEIAKEVLSMRQEHPGWGPLTILVELRKDNRFAGLTLPCRSRIAAYLKQKGKVKHYERHQKMPEPAPKVVTRAHQEWELDAIGKVVFGGLGNGCIINILDVASLVKVDSLPCLRSVHANTLDYQLLLRRAFVSYGLPEQISFDHDAVFYDNQTSSPFPTLLHLWLIGLGVGVRFIHKTPPEEHARIERHHQTITNQAILGQSFRDQNAIQQGLTERLHFLNSEFPCQSLGGQAPLTACPQAQTTLRPYRLEWEKDSLDMQRIYAFLAKGKWIRWTSTVGMFSLGSQRYNARTKYANQNLTITFDPQIQEFCCLPEKEMPSFYLAPKGLTKEALMGELDPLMAVPAYQLALPFSPQAWRQNILCLDLGVTTF